jgi:uncharacterized protein (TIGR02996 family)
VTLTTTIAAMLAAVRESPDDDTPRLALADVLAETDPDEGGDAGWAEFLRVQVELARWKRDDARVSLSPSGITRHAELRRRSDALLAANEARWRRGPACERCGGKGKIRVRLSSNRHWTRTDPARRRQNHASCPDCAGTGWTGPLGARDNVRFSSQHPPDEDWSVPAEFRRGFIHRISTPLADVFDGNDVTEWAVRVARWPQVCLEEWGVTDDGLVWQTSYENPPMWYWNPRRIPQSVWDILDPQADAASAGFPFDTEAAARLALAKAVAAVVNEAAHD